MTKLVHLVMPLAILRGMTLMGQSQSQESIHQEFLEAARKGSTARIIELIQAGVDCNVQIGDSTALHCAAEGGHTDTLKALIERGADVNSNAEGKTPLYCAAYGDQRGCLKALLKANAVVNVRTKSGVTALHWAAKHGDLEGVRALIKAKAGVNFCAHYEDFSRITALHWAAEEGHAECVKALIEAHADVNARMVSHLRYLLESQYTALHLAAYNGHSDCVKILIDAQAEINASAERGATALYLAATAGHLASVKLLIEAKAHLNACANDGSTPLCQAAKNGYVDCVKALLEVGADMRIRDMSDYTALHRAAMEGHSDCLKALIRSSYCYLPAAEAVSVSRKRIFNVLLQFVWLRKRNPKLDNLKSESLQFEILSYNRILQADLVLIFLDELKKGREIKGAALIRSKDSVVRYLQRKISEMVADLHTIPLDNDMRSFLDREKIYQLVKEGLNDRIEELKAKKLK